MPDVTQRPGVPDASLGELVGQLSEQTSRLIRDEMALAKTELQASAKHAGLGVGLFGGAGLFALLGLITLVGAAVAGLATALDVWLSALIVGAALLVVAGIAGLLGKKEVGQAGPPERTIENVKQDVAEVKGRKG